MNEAVIVSAARTAVGKAPNGSLRATRPDDLAAVAIDAVLQRAAAVDRADVEDVILGCAMPEAEQGMNVARAAAIRAGLPVETSAMTINRFCSSGLQTIAMAAQRVIAGEADAYVAGGVESISCVQQEMNKHMLAERWLTENKPAIYMSMLETAETVAKRYNIPKQRMDEYGAASQQKAAAAREAGRFDAEIAPITVTAGVADPVSWPG